MNNENREEISRYVSLIYIRTVARNRFGGEGYALNVAKFFHG
jgi:hypothetical protein